MPSASSPRAPNLQTMTDSHIHLVYKLELAQPHRNTMVKEKLDRQPLNKEYESYQMNVNKNGKLGPHTHFSQKNDHLSNKQCR